MGIREDVLALAEELDGVSIKDDCDACLASGTSLCRGDLECAESAHKACAKRLREIVEHDECEDTTVSAYDLLGDDDREALAWVLEMGGVEAAKASIHQGAMEHGCLLKVAEMLGTSIYDGTGNADALLDKLEKRLMPEGMEWPTVDGKPVDFKTAYGPSLGVLEAVSIYNTGACQVMSHDGIVKNATEIHIVKPKVLNADGVEIREGDVLYSVETGDYVTVGSIEPGNPWFAATDGELQHCAKFTHRAPVFAADGMPLREGEHVYHVETGAELVVKELPKPGEYQAVVVFALPTSPASHLTSFDPDRLTHERPVLDEDGVPIKVGDTVWDIETGIEFEVTGIASAFEIRVKDESMKIGVWTTPCGFTHAKPEPPDTWERIEGEIERGKTYTDELVLSIVRRCRALAERGA